jgi:hypothetical protein
MTLEVWPGLFDLVESELKLERQALCQPRVADYRQIEFATPLARYECIEGHSVNRAKAKLVSNFFTARVACFHRKLLVLWQALTSDGESFLLLEKRSGNSEIRLISSRAQSSTIRAVNHPLDGTR